MRYHSHEFRILTHELPETQDREEEVLIAVCSILLRGMPFNASMDFAEKAEINVLVALGLAANTLLVVVPPEKISMASGLLSRVKAPVMICWMKVSCSLGLPVRGLERWKSSSNQSDSSGCWRPSPKYVA